MTSYFIEGEGRGLLKVGVGRQDPGKIVESGVQREKRGSVDKTPSLTPSVTQGGTDTRTPLSRNWLPETKETTLHNLQTTDHVSTSCSNSPNTTTAFLPETRTPSVNPT